MAGKVMLYLIAMVVFWGKVKKGKGRGKTLGFPTANVRLKKHIPEGIYISQTKMEGQIYPSVTWIGTAKTFHETEYLSETYILSPVKSIYNRWISVRLLKKIRDNEFFETPQLLVAQMQKDIVQAKQYFSLRD